MACRDSLTKARSDGYRLTLECGHKCDAFASRFIPTGVVPCVECREMAKESE